ncbi:MAG TPA: NUMOD3 domain-containing DNA-binding protein [Candidatus Paceibacterota bacterium]|nr:NUMOD3 domain-containing DNA-binding protein [Candidatus Paceibacterota bacterium]
MEKIFYIYLISNKINNKSYVGFHSTFDLNDSYMGSGIAIKKAMEKYGEKNFKKEILEYCNRGNWREREIYWIEKLDTYNNGYNLTKGGDGLLGFSHNEKTKTKLSNLHSGKKLSIDHKQKIGNSLKGNKNLGGWNKSIKWDEEVKNKISRSNKGKKHTEDSKRKMRNSKRFLYSDKINHPRSKIFIVHKPDNSKLICIGTFRKFRDNNKSKYNKYFKSVIESGHEIDGWYFKEYNDIKDIKNIQEYTLYEP